MIPQGASGLAFAHRAKRLCLICGLLGLLAPSGLLADWRAAQEASVLNGVQAVLMCNGLFTSGRSLTQVYDQELKYLSPPRFRSALGDANGGPYRVDQVNRSVIVGTDNPEQQVAAVYQPGFGCIVLAPGELPTAEVVAELPVYPAIESEWLTIATVAGGDLKARDVSAEFDPAALAAAADWVFDRSFEEQVTVSLLVTYQGQVVLERYAPGFDSTTRTRTWSTAKGLAAILIGMLVDEGALVLDKPLAADWLPALNESQQDPRRRITLRHALTMSTGLEPVDNNRQEYKSGSGLAYWAGDSSSVGARARGLVRDPGTYWDYENYDTLLAVNAMKQAIGKEVEYWRFPAQRLLHKLGMDRTVLSVDRQGDFILSSQVYTNARDLAKIGQLLLNDGVWAGERLLSSEWIAFMRSPANIPNNPRGQYGGQWWLVPKDRDDVPRDAFSAAGSRGQFLIVVPSKDLVIVRRGLDFGRRPMSQWDLTREILKAWSAS